jgi:outer membrane protein OmpA-like peptidoglycan-associated protein
MCAALLAASLPAITRAEGLDAERFVPAAGASSGLMVERPLVIPHLVPGAGLFLNFADDALVETDRDTGETLSRPLDSALTFDLIASLGLLDWMELSLQMPVHAYYDGDSAAVGATRVQASEGVGDLRLTPIGVFYRGAGDTPFVLGGSLPITFPTGSHTGLRGEGGLTVEPRLLVGLLGRRLGLFANVGLRFRPQAEDTDPVGHELTFGVGASYALVGDRDVLDILVELVGAWDVSEEGPELTDVPLEAWAALGWKVHPDWTVFGGVGPGLTDGLGTPDVRVLAGVRWTPRGQQVAAYKDSDGDGIADVHDKCPADPEDADAFEDQDGCPEADNDADGVADDVDECPDVPEPKGNDGDGCPDRGLVVVRGGKILIVGKVQFATGSATIQPRSNQLVTDIAAAFNDHPEITKIEIQGHTDDVGDDDVNLKLSRARAESVKRELVKRGVAGDRLETQGYGETQPVAPNKTRAGRAKNRRVEFVVKER